MMEKVHSRHLNGILSAPEIVRVMKPSTCFVICEMPTCVIDDCHMSQDEIVNKLRIKQRRSASERNSA